MGEERNSFDPENGRQDQDTRGFPRAKRAAGILVVDDDSLVRRFVVASLESRGFAVLEASSGQEGLNYFFEKNDIQLVVSDILMPVMSGPEMVQRILKLDSSVKVMFMTGTDPDRRLLGLSAKKYLLLHKPFTLDTLLKGVDQCLAT